MYYISIWPMCHVIWKVAFLATGEESVTDIAMPQSKQTRYNLPMLFQCWASVEYCGSTLKHHLVNAMCLLMCWRKVYCRPSVGSPSGQRRRRLTGIELARGCHAGLTLSRNWVGRPTCVYPRDKRQHESLASIEWMLASTCDGGGRNTRRRYILTFFLGSFGNYILDIQPNFCLLHSNRMKPDRGARELLF